LQKKFSQPAKGNTKEKGYCRGGEKKKSTDGKWRKESLHRKGGGGGDYLMIEGEDHSKREKICPPVRAKEGGKESRDLKCEGGRGES